MDASSIKSKILQDIMDLMDSKMVDDLKGRSPKFGMAKVDIQSDDPSLAEELKDKLTNESDEERSESPEEALSERRHPSMEDGEHGDDLERLRELYERLK